MLPSSIKPRIDEGDQTKIPGHTLNPNHVRPAILLFKSIFCSLVYSALTRALYWLASTWPFRHLWSPWATKVMHGPQHEAQITSVDASEHVCTPVELAATRGGDGTTNLELRDALLSPRSVDKDLVDQEKASGMSNGSSGSDHLSDDRHSSTAQSHLGRRRAVSEGPSASRERMSPGLIPLDSVGPTLQSTPPLGNQEPVQLSTTATRGVSTPNSAPSTPSADMNRAYSFVFTSSRPQRAVGGERVIGIVNPSMTQVPAPKRLSASPISEHKPTLTPQQVRAHALGAVHAISEDSPFPQLARGRLTSTVAQMNIPLQTSISLDSSNPIERSLQTHGIDFYVNAARAGRTSTSDGQASTPPERPSYTHRTQSYTSTLASLGEDRVHNAITEPSSPVSEIASTSKMATRSKKKRVKSYSRYVEDDSWDQFVTVPIKRSREPSQGSSNSSGSTRLSIDESLTAMSCFGVIGSTGSPVDVFGSAVVRTSRTSDPGTRSPASICSSSSTARNSSRATPTPARLLEDPSPKDENPSGSNP